MAISNLARGKITWSNSGNSTKVDKWRYLILTDGAKASVPYLDGGSSADGNPVKVVLDFGHVCTVSEIKVWHYYADARYYHNSIVEVSEDGITWETIFDSAVSGTYTETSAGKTHSFAPRNVRFVRDGIKGSNKNTGNHWVELEVWGEDPTPDEIVKLESVADTMTAMSSKTSNYGSGISMTGLHYTNYDYDIWVKFNVEKLIAEGITQVKQAIMRAYYYYGDIPSRRGRLEIYALTSAWDEATMTYNTRPTWEVPWVDALDAVVTSNYGYGWQEADLTDLVNQWLQGTKQNYGVRGDNSGVPNSGWNAQKYYTKEYSDPVYHPYIEVQYNLLDEDPVTTQNIVFAQFM